MIGRILLLLDKFNTLIFALHPRIKVGKGAIIRKGARLLVRKSGKIYIGCGSIIEFSAVLDTCDGIIRIGRNSTVQIGCVLYGHGTLTIGSGVRIAAGTKIIPANHVYSDRNIPIYKQGVIADGITINDDVWIGANCVVTDGVVVGEGVVIGAGSLVSKSLHNYKIYAGVPAKMIGER